MEDATFNNNRNTLLNERYENHNHEIDIESVEDLTITFKIMDLDRLLKLGIKKYGFHSVFMDEYNSLRQQIRHDKFDFF